MIYILQFLVTIAVCYQVTSIISESSFPLFKWLRHLDEVRTNDLFKIWVFKGISNFFSCFLCVSVWIGFLCGRLLFDLAKFVEYESLTWAISGLVYSFICWFIHLVEGKLS